MIFITYALASLVFFLVATKAGITVDRSSYVVIAILVSAQSIVDALENVRKERK